MTDVKLQINQSVKDDLPPAIGESICTSISKTWQTYNTMTISEVQNHASEHLHTPTEVNNA